MTKPATGGGELFIDLDIVGLAALMKTIEVAMVDGRGHLNLQKDGGMAVRSGSPNRFAKVIVTFAGPTDPPDDSWRSGRPDPGAAAPPAHSSPSGLEGRPARSRRSAINFARPPIPL